MVVSFLFFFSFSCQSPETVKLVDPDCLSVCLYVSVCVSVCLCVCLSVRLCVYVCPMPAISQKPLKRQLSTLTAVTASVTRMPHVFRTLTVSFIQGHTDLHRENNKRSIISENCSSNPSPLRLL